MKTDISALHAEIECLRQRLARVENEVSAAEQKARQAHHEILQLRDALAAAQRDQQDLRTVRAQLGRIRLRGLIGRILNRR